LSKTFFAEYCYDEDGRLIKVIVNLKSGVRFVSKAFIYNSDELSAMLSYRPESFSFGQYGLYCNGRLSLVARFNKFGKVLFCERIFYKGGLEDFSARHVSRQGDNEFNISDLRLDIIAGDSDDDGKP
jgi:hypothetical protein